MSYLLSFGTVLLALFSLHKDWTNYKHPWVRKAVITLISLVGAAQALKIYYDGMEAQIIKTTASNNINTLKAEVAGLQGQVKASNDAQAQNTTVFLQQFNRLSDRMRELQTEITTEELRKQLASVQSDLQKTQKAMAPAPKAALTFTFVPFKDLLIGQGKLTNPVSDKSLSLAPDGTIHVEFTILNLTDVSALDGEIHLVICHDCKFAKEPPEFQKIVGEGDNHRFMAFQRLLPMMKMQTMAIDILVPDAAEALDVGITFRCRTCVIPQAVSGGRVHILR